MVKNLLFFFVLFAPFALNAQEKSKSAEQFENEIDNKMPRLLHDFSIPGAAIAIIENGKIILQKGYGFSDIEKEVKVTPKTGFNIGSISKTVTAWGIMKLVQEGKIDLDAPAEKYLTRWHLPESEFNSDKVTVRRLLSHTAGISLPSVSAELSFDNLPTIVEWLNGKNEGMGRVEIILEPGTKWEYSGGGYGLLQLIIEEVTNQKFEDYMQVEVLDPLGMQNSSFKISDKVLSTSATPYDKFGEPTDFGLYTVQSAAGLHSTLEDFIRFAFASLPAHEDHQKYNSVLPAKTVQQMMEPAPNSATGGWKYGLGYQTVHQGSSQVFIGHSGSNTGWQASFRLDPVSNNGFIVLTNGSAGDYIGNAMFCELMNGTSFEPGGNDCWSKPSIARKLYQIIEDKGIEDIAAAYETLKKEQPDEYDFSESQLNELGYDYTGQGELEKAITIFKLNTEVFPDSYNTFDSYGEALLAQGAKKASIESYRKSVELHPGNANGVKVLNELGITNDDLTKSLSIAMDTQVLAEYVGRFQTATGETMAIRMHEGLLTAEVQGQQLNLVAESTARFQALGDGAIITFFTAATGQKGLWTRKRIWKKLQEPPTGEGASKESPGHSSEEALSTGNFLVFRNGPSWGRMTDFENVLGALGCKHEQQKSSTMADVDLSPYDVIIIPGGQLSDFYNDYIINVERFDDYVASGGTLVLELNWAEKTPIILPRSVTLVSHKALENEILESNHPIFLPLSGKRLIQARHASNGYLQNVPHDALILAVETSGADPLVNRPTFVEYPYGKGRVIAGLQCFHDRDGSGRGPLMESVISYALSKSWAAED